VAEGPGRHHHKVRRTTMEEIFPRLPGPDRCCCCGGFAFFYCGRCELSLCVKDRICPECESDEDVCPLDPPNRQVFTPRQIV
jgi:hypothetical protein